MNTQNQDRTPLSLPISKLRGVPLRTRVVLKSRRITSCKQLMDAAGDADRRGRLAETTGIDRDLLLLLTQRADMSRLSGVGAVFGLMLEEVGVHDVPSLASKDADALFESLRDYNQRERLARRSPTRDEVEHWIEQAKALDPVVTYTNGDGRKTSDMS